jgi:hypothetical protein
MPCYVLVARNGQETRSPRCYTAADLRAFKRSASCYTFIGELTNKTKNVGQGCRRGRGLGFSLWPFTKKKPKPRVGSQRIYWVPGPGKGSAMTKRGHGVMRGARRGRR